MAKNATHKRRFRILLICGTVSSLLLLIAVYSHWDDIMCRLFPARHVLGRWEFVEQFGDRVLPTYLFNQWIFLPDGSWDASDGFCRGNLRTYVVQGSALVLTEAPDNEQVEPDVHRYSIRFQTTSLLYLEAINRGRVLWRRVRE